MFTEFESNPVDPDSVISSCVECNILAAYELEHTRIPSNLKSTAF